MYHTAYFQDGKIKFKIENVLLMIGIEWLIYKMTSLGFEISSYSNIDCSLSLYGECQDDNIIEIKKFIHDNYPYVKSICPRIYGFNIDFSLPVNII